MEFFIIFLFIVVILMCVFHVYVNYHFIIDKSLYSSFNEKRLCENCFYYLHPYHACENAEKFNLDGTNCRFYREND